MSFMTQEEINVSLFDENKRLNAEIQKLNAEIERLKLIAEWQPIETAPKDWRLIELYDEQYYSAKGCYKRGEWVSSGGNVMFPTHWRPIPDGPIQ